MWYDFVVQGAGCGALINMVDRFRNVSPVYGATTSPFLMARRVTTPHPCGPAQTSSPSRSRRCCKQKGSQKQRLTNPRVKRHAPAAWRVRPLRERKALLRTENAPKDVIGTLGVAPLFHTRPKIFTVGRLFDCTPAA